MVDITVTRQEAVERAASLVDQGEYILGTGNYRPSQDADGNAVDLPFTQREGAGPAGCDCAGFAVCWCYKIVRHQPGFNAGAWATVSDDINVDSVIEDARHDQALGTVITTPVEGAWLLYPTIRDPRNPQPFIGHVAIIETVPAEFDPDSPDYRTRDRDSMPRAQRPEAGDHPLRRIFLVESRPALAEAPAPQRHGPAQCADEASFLRSGMPLSRRRSRSARLASPGAVARCRPAA